ncbi:zinc-dependent alcohol dehydrogenase family protein [Arthrobacter sp. FW306-05-C]|uniref:zinc-dependent alcohol dehydrogenase family protein n=1 Tax=Arthrobacter TaxID=1663 RepID=UPI001EF00BC0|nr:MULTISPECIES: zinc-dependent alcohol dehydrogenase family protein [Arthrobacter]MDP9985050.1 propanol-preferring alcohol dehydrogenase [Arthrobacter oryzae]UKA65415.1 zinc-dependent alcohol dehydrogenase family protein [Arthrobacter sp. FW306-05-C]UKA69799.1 zinc-dependent alcohol dehydrogenase family protein [Arthrobacter sp. FW306-06-A]UKA74098.1 zinc-dependent alcohol dehydrogenase family protein [Arthrobacter sp. FW306-07-I]
MRAWWVNQPGPISTHPLLLGERPTPRPAAGELLVEVSVCGVCRTDLHLAEGDLAPRHPHVVPGHEAVGVVIETGADCTRFTVGDRVGVAWLGGTCGRCPYCRRSEENLCSSPVFTGWDRDGGYAEHLTVAEDFAYPLPASFTDEQAAPLLCSGIIGYRALKRAALPVGGRLGIYGFGSSAHITAQLALKQGASVFVMTRSPGARSLALDLGAEYAGDAYAEPPVPLDSAILFAPAGDLVPVALRALDRGGTLTIAGIHLSDIPALDYARELFFERQVRSVTANTRRDGQEFLTLAARLSLALTTTVYPFAAADKALEDLAADRITGSAVLRVRPEQAVQ